MSEVATRMGDMSYTPSVGERVAVYIPTRRDLELDDEDRDRIAETAVDVLTRECANHDLSASDIELVWVKPADEVTEGNPFGDMDIDRSEWLLHRFEATAA